MKIFPASLLLFLMLPLGLSAQPEPVLRYEFENPGSVQSSTGSGTLDLTTYTGTRQAPVAGNYVVTPPVQRAGGGSHALDFSATSTGFTAQTTNLSSTTALTSGLGSFTIAAWVLDFEPINDARFFFLTGGSSRFGGGRFLGSAARSLLAGVGRECRSVSTGDGSQPCLS